MERKVNSRADDRVCGAVEKSEGDQIDLVGVELMFEDGGGVQAVGKTSARALTASGQPAERP